MSVISVQKGNKPQVEMTQTLIDETRNLSDQWQHKSDKAIAEMLHRAIPGYYMTSGSKFTLPVSIPGGKTAKITMTTIQNGSSINQIDLLPNSKIHVC